MAMVTQMKLKAKADIRKTFREIVSAIPSSIRQEAAYAAAKRFINLPCYKESEHIACYLATKNEFDASPIIEAVWQAKKQCYVPVLSQENEKSLCFARYEYGDALHINRHAILEPVNAAHKVAPEDLDLVVLPLVAFDCYGHRLGTGGGYYDRTFAFLHAKPSKKPTMMGLAFAAQQIDLLPFDPWDIFLEAVLTENEFIFCS
jgi:5-formyltetrahydrofolate cyclo-ligase